MSKHIETVRDLQVYLDREYSKLVPAYNKDYLNYKGCCMCKLYSGLVQIIPFYVDGTVKEFYESDRVQELLDKYNGVPDAMKLRDFLQHKSKSII